MCWGVPARVVKLREYTAVVDFGGGSTREVILAVRNVKEGDLVMVHAGAIIGRISREELLESLKLYEEIASSLSENTGKEEMERRVTRYKDLLGDSFEK